MGFQPAGSTVNVAVTATAQNITPSGCEGPNAGVILTNIGSQTVFIHLTATATVSNGMPLLANTAMGPFQIPAGAAISVIAAATGSTLYATSGYGE